jgi:pyruvate-formate lyase-activating enzyme/TusA-related sulfurtransferase
MALKARIEIETRGRTFASGLLLDVVAALRETVRGDLVAVAGDDPAVGRDLETWSRLTRNPIVGVTSENGRTRWVFRHGHPPGEEDAARPLGERLWLYTNFDCNLRCDYCCVRSSPTTSRRELGVELVRRIVAQARPLGLKQLFVTGGEPFLLPDIAQILRSCADAAPTTVLTNAMLFRGGRLEALRALPRERLILQISLDSPSPELHDRHRGSGSWDRAWAGVETARREGFRVRLAATVSTHDEAERFAEFLDRNAVAPEDRVIRRIALRGFAEDGLALSRADLVPEMTVTARGVYWHPVGAADDDFLVTPDILPLATALEAVRAAVEREREHATRVASVFHCA